MKALFKALILLGAAIFALASCGKQDAEEGTLPGLKGVASTVSSDGTTMKVTVGAEADWTLSVQYAAGSGWISLSKSSGNGLSRLEVTVKPNTSESPRSATLVLKTRSYEVSQGLVQQSSYAGSGPGWLELPAFNGGSSVHFIVHDMSGDAYIDQATSGMRNWSCYYDYNEYVSYWVAYPLNSALIGKGSRTNLWALDPLVPKAYQVSLLSASGGYGGGWTRGHQIPSADRYSYAGKSTNETTFYMTNMAPQDYDYNAGVWGRLESAVRTWAGSTNAKDTLYVATGCDIRYSTGLTGNSGGHQVKIPNAFFKALLRKKGNDYSAVGFYLPHDRVNNPIYKRDYKEFKYSIDQLEEMTGLDFFVNLPAIVGKEKAAAIEAADPATTLNNW